MNEKINVCMMPQNFPPSKYFSSFLLFLLYRLEVNLEKKAPLGNWPMLLADISNTTEEIPNIQQVSQNYLVG